MKQTNPRRDDQTIPPYSARWIRPVHWTVQGIAVVMVGLAYVTLILTLLFVVHDPVIRAHAAPIPPPQGMPKLTESTMAVSPTLAPTGGAVLGYTIEIRNTGSYTASQVAFTNTIPLSATYNNDAQSSGQPAPTFSGGAVRWVGQVGFDSVVRISFSLTVSPTFEGLLTNSAQITNRATGAVTVVAAETRVTDEAIFIIDKTALPALPGANKPLTYTLTVTNIGQPASDTPITVTDQLPANTTLRSIGPDGSNLGGLITWSRTVDLDTGQTSVFTFSVTLNNVAAGTVITNANYLVTGAGAIAYGVPYTTTVVRPALSIAKAVDPDPPGANEAMIYQLTVLNTGSLATSLVITDRVPTGVTYVSGGTLVGGVVSWTLARLDTGQTASFSYTVSIGDVAQVPIVNNAYRVCSAEGVCRAGSPLTSVVAPPRFETWATVDPIAKKPGGGGSPVTPTLVIKNHGPGSALDATALLQFTRISVQQGNLIVIPATGVISPGPVCGSNCTAYLWKGNILSGDTITITTDVGQSTIGGSEGLVYSATVVVTDRLGLFTTTPVSSTAVGYVTHLANLVPTKTAPSVIGAGELLTYTLDVFNSGQSQEVPPYPTLTDTLPLSTTLVSISDGGISRTLGTSTIVSWTLPTISTGDSLRRQFTVRVKPGLSAGTQIINKYYGTTWFNTGPGLLSNAGPPITTTVEAVGLIDSFKRVSPELALPGPDNVLTYTIHVVNSGAIPLEGVKVADLLPWQHSTYQRDALASAGTVISDIVSLNWTGNLAPFSAAAITFTVAVDPYFSGAITNTATISHPDLLAPVLVHAVAYITDDPVLHIAKTATPSPLLVDTTNDLEYTLTVANLGQQATTLVITDRLPLNTQYVANSATAGGQLIGNTVRWQTPVLGAGETLTFKFKVRVSHGPLEIVNSQYRVASAEGSWAVGAPVVTKTYSRFRWIYLPLVLRR